MRLKRPGATGDANSGPQRNRRLEYCCLLDLEQLLSEQVGLAGGGRKRLKIEAELSQIRRDLERLGLRLQSRLLRGAFLKRSVVRNGLDDKLVPVRGVVDVASELGVFLTNPRSPSLHPGGPYLERAPKTKIRGSRLLQINRDFALREGLVAQGTINPAPARLARRWSASQSPCTWSKASKRSATR
jgi:hypothetical protein